MAGRISRRVLARYVAERLIQNDSTIVSQLAAFLIDTKRTKELPLIVHDIEDALLAHGKIVANVISARTLTAETEKAIATFLNTSYKGDVYLRTSIDESVLGGVKVRTPDAELDATLRRKITNLQATKL